MLSQKNTAGTVSASGKKLKSKSSSEHNKNAGKRNEKIDFDSINFAALSALPAILSRLLPGGQLASVEYIVRNPRRADRSPGSFRINLRNGRWADFATGDRGGDPVSLVAYIEDTTQGDAAKILAQILGIAHE